MNIEDSRAIDNALQAAYHEVYSDELGPKTQEKLMDKFYDLIDATVFPDGENELDFESGIELGIKLSQNTAPGVKLYKTAYDHQAFYFVGTEDEIVKKINTIFDCCCPTDVLLRSGCQCNGN